MGLRRAPRTVPASQHEQPERRARQAVRLHFYSGARVGRSVERLAITQLRHFIGGSSVLFSCLQLQAQRQGMASMGWRHRA